MKLKYYFYLLQSSTQSLDEDTVLFHPVELIAPCQDATQLNKEFHMLTFIFLSESMVWEETVSKVVVSLEQSYSSFNCVNRE